MNEPRSHIGFCPHCGNRAPQKIALEHSYRDEWFSDDGKKIPSDDGPMSEAIVCICATCNSLLVYDGVSQDDVGYWPPLMYPRNASFGSMVPGVVREIYAEAAAVKRNAPNAFAILIRKGVEAICDDRGIKSGTLGFRLKALADNGEIPPLLAEASDLLRIVGNTAAHNGLQRITQPMTWAIDDFFRTVVEYVYVAPSKLNDFRDAMEKARRNQVP
jgi:hypothetical protein